ncbi:MAG: hypothetical protein ACKKMS_03260 [Candidatus Nealsonbacteria bacterium]
MNSYSLTQSISQRLIVLPKLPKIGLKAFWILSFISIISLLIFYIFQVNAMIGETYLIQNYQRKIKELSQENKTLEINFSQANSLSTIETLVKNLNFEKVERIHYIQVLESQVVTK